jgi:MFS family permease
VKFDAAIPISPTSEQLDVAQSARRRIAIRLLPFLFVLYIVAFLDRMNVGAAALQMPGDLGFSERAVGLGAGIFFLGYFLLQIPGALIAERHSARRWIAGVMILWGLLTVLMAFVHTEREFYTVRFVVGAAEAGFFPAVVVYLTHWFRSVDRAKAVAVFYAAMPLSYVIGSPLAGLLLGLSWLGLRGCKRTGFAPKNANGSPRNLITRGKLNKKFAPTRFGKPCVTATLSCSPPAISLQPPETMESRFGFPPC